MVYKKGKRHIDVLLPFFMIFYFTYATIHRSMLRVSSLKFTPTFITFRLSEARAEA